MSSTQIVRRPTKRPVTLYKLTNAAGETRDRTLWGNGVTHTIPKSRRRCSDLCSSGFLHAYESPLMAVVMNQSHGSFFNYRMYKARGIVRARDGHLKCGTYRLTTITRIEPPRWTVDQLRVALCLVTLRTNPSLLAKEIIKAWVNGKLKSKHTRARLFRAVTDLTFSDFVECNRLRSVLLMEDPVTVASARNILANALTAVTRHNPRKPGLINLLKLAHETPKSKAWGMLRAKLK